MSTRRFRLASLTLAVALGLLAWTTLPNLAEEKPAEAQAVSGNVTISVQAVGEGEPAQDVQSDEARKRLDYKRHEIERHIEATNAKIAEIKSRLSASKDGESEEASRERKLISIKLEELQRERARLIVQRQQLDGITIGVPISGKEGQKLFKNVGVSHRAQGHAIMVVKTEGDEAEVKQEARSYVNLEMSDGTSMRIALNDNPAAQQRIKLLKEQLAEIRDAHQKLVDKESDDALREKATWLQQELDQLLESQDQELLAQIAHGLGLKAKMQPVPARGFPILNGQLYLGRDDDKHRDLRRAGVVHRAQGHSIMVVGTEGDETDEKPNQPQVFKFELKGHPQVKQIEGEEHPELRERQDILHKLMNRIRHLMQAAENLEHAGDHDLAQGLREKVKHLQAEAKEHQAKLEASVNEMRHRQAEAMARFYPDWESKHIAQLKETVADLRNEVRELRAEIRALREALNDGDKDGDDAKESDGEKPEKRRDAEHRDKQREENPDGNRGDKDRSDKDKDRDETKNDHRGLNLIIPAGAIQVIRANPPETKKPRQLGIEFKLTGAGPNGRIQFITVGESESTDDDAVEARKPDQK